MNYAKSQHSRRWALNALTFVVPLAFYIFTCAPTIGLGDTALLLDQIERLRITTHVNNHNFTILIGWLLSFLPGENFAFKGNLLSVLLGASTVCVFFWLLFELFRNRISAAAGASVLMLSHSMWWHSTIVECYAANALFTALFIWILVRSHTATDYRWVIPLFFLAGLSTFNHVQLGALCIGAAASLLARMVASPRSALILFGQASVAFFLGWLPWLVTFYFDMRALGSFSNALNEAFFGHFKGIMLQGSWSYGLYETGVLFLIQTPHIFLALIPAGLGICLVRWGWRSPATIGLLTAVLINTWFFLFYNTWDRFAFLLPSFVIFIFFGCFALDALVVRIVRAQLPARALAMTFWIGSLVWSWYFYGQLSVWGADPSSRWYARCNNIYTENTHRVNEFIFNPNKRSYTDVEDYIFALFRKLPAGAIYIDDDSRVYYPVEFYQRRYGLRPDLNLVLMNSWGFDNWGATHGELARLLRGANAANREVFFVSLMPPFRSIIDQLDDLSRMRLAFERYQIDSTRWVYRLKSINSRDNESAQLPKLVLSEDRQRFDLKAEQVLLAPGVELIDQTMQGFGNLWGNMDQLFIRFGRVGQAVVIAIESAEARGVDIDLLLTTAPDYGIVSFELNGTQIVDDVDLYSEQVAIKSVSVARQQLNLGANSFGVRLKAKNPKSSGYIAGIDSISINKR